MPDPILDDVRALLEKEFGDKRILEQILRAAKNDEVISNFERNYVRKLAEKHLGKKPLIEKKVEEPKQSTSTIPEPIPPKPIQPKPAQTIQTLSSPKISKSGSKNTKIFLGIGLAALIVIVVAAVSFSGLSELPTTIKTDQTPKTSTSKSFSIKTDQSSYSTGDIISISGNSKIPFGGQVDLSIKNSNNDIVWSEKVNVKLDGQFSTLTFAGGSGWEKSGSFTIVAEGNSETTSNTFSFRN